MNHLVLLVPLLFSIHQILVRKGSSEAETVSGIYVSLLASTLIFIPSIQHPTLDRNFIILMSTAGVLHFFVARICFYHAISRIGANLSAPLSATRVFFAALIGIFVGETLTMRVAVMSMLIFAGILFISRPRGKADTLGITLGILTGFFSAISSYFVKFGNAVDYNPLFAVFLGFALSSILMTPLAVRKDLHNTKWYFAAGVVAGLAHFIRYVVLKDVPVTVVEPITSSYPLFTLLLSAMFLREREVFTARSITGTILILAGFTFTTPELHQTNHKL